MKIINLLLLLLLFASFTLPSASAVASPPAQQVLPPEGWQLCQDLGVVPIPGVGDAQLFEMCQGEGWTVRAYCLDPGMPIPQVGEFCSLLNGDTFWCGDGIQQLRLYQILETPVPETPFPTMTPTSTSTITSTSTSTPTASPTSTSTPTPTPSPTIQGGSPTPRPDTPVPTVYYRPSAGGPGNSAVFTLLGGLALGLILAGAGGLGFWLKRILRLE